ncbi:unnamed protein product, partial [marine sediment metagenome]
MQLKTKNPWGAREMNCQRIKKLINPYIDKTLDADMAK